MSEMLPDPTAVKKAEREIAESASEFGRRIYAEAYRRGWNRAQKKVVMGDGAEWIWNTSQELFPGATEIVDLYHARQHLWDLGAGLHPSEEAVRRRWIMKHQPLLDEGKIEKLGPPCALSDPGTPSLHNRCKRKPTTSKETRSGCVIRASVAKACLWGPELSRLDARRSSATA